MLLKCLERIDPCHLSGGNADNLGMQPVRSGMRFPQRPVFRGIDRFGRLYVLAASFRCHKHGPDQDSCRDGSNQVYGHTNLCHGHFDSFRCSYGHLDGESNYRLRILPRVLSIIHSRLEIGYSYSVNDLNNFESSFWLRAKDCPVIQGGLWARSNCFQDSVQMSIFVDPVPMEPPCDLFYNL